MKHFVLAFATTSLGLAAIATPAQAAVFGWNVEYTGWWEESGGGSISGMFSANEEDAADGIVSIDEMLSWMWSWSGNDTIPAFSISSEDEGVSTEFDPSFYVDGTPNVPDPANPDDLDQGSFISGDGENILDLEALLVITEASNADGPFIPGNPDASQGTVFVSEPETLSDSESVPEPATLLGLLVLAGMGAATLKQRKQTA